MRPTTLRLPDELDARVRVEAVRRGMSTAEPIWCSLAAVLQCTDERRRGNDPWRDLAGFGSRGGSTEASQIGTVVYRD